MAGLLHSMELHPERRPTDMEVSQDLRDAAFGKGEWEGQAFEALSDIERIESFVKKFRALEQKPFRDAAALLADLRRAFDSGVFFLPSGGSGRDRGLALLDRLKAAGFPPHQDVALPGEGGEGA